jgi:hypothetical protein
MVSETEDASGNPAIMINGLYSVYLTEWQK